jgi:hypothetical protein
MESARIDDCVKPAAFARRRHFLGLGLMLPALGLLGWLTKPFDNPQMTTEAATDSDRCFVVNGWVIPEKLIG